LKDKNESVDIYLNSFTFRPAFLNPTHPTKDQLTVGDFDARVGNPTIDAFPKLIDPASTDQQDGVKFAGDKTKVYLYKNNDVDVIGYGENILIRGTVLDKNNEDGLTAYYYLNAYVLNVTAYELEDQAYIASDGLSDGNYQFTFSGNIKAVDGSVTVQVQEDAGTATEVTATIDGTLLKVPFNSLTAGATYRITIPENTIALSNDATTKNSEIVRTFSVNKAVVDNVGELQVNMIYPSGLATVGTTIVLETYVNGETSGLSLADGKKVTGVLSATDETDMSISAIISNNQLAFKPTSTLKPNTMSYTDIG